MEQVSYFHSKHSFFRSHLSSPQNHLLSPKRCKMQLGPCPTIKPQKYSNRWLSLEDPDLLPIPGKALQLFLRLWLTGGYSRGRQRYYGYPNTSKLSGSMGAAAYQAVNLITAWGSHVESRLAFLFMAMVGSRS